MKIVTAFAIHKTAIGEQCSFTFSEINEAGKVVAQNNRADVVILDDEVLGSVQTVYEYLKTKIPEQGGDIV